MREVLWVAMEGRARSLSGGVPAAEGAPTRASWPATRSGRGSDISTQHKQQLRGERDDKDRGQEWYKRCEELLRNPGGRQPNGPQAAAMSPPRSMRRRACNPLSIRIRPGDNKRHVIWRMHRGSQMAVGVEHFPALGGRFKRQTAPSALALRLPWH